MEGGITKGDGGKGGGGDWGLEKWGVSNMDIFWRNTLDVIKCSDWLKHALKLFYKSNRPHFLWVYQHNNPRKACKSLAFRS